MPKMVWWEGKLVPGQHCEDAPCCGCCGSEAERATDRDDYQDDFIYDNNPEQEDEEQFNYVADSNPDDDYEEE